MYISKFGSGNNVYVRLMESYRGSDGKPRSRVIRNFGRYDDLVKDNPNAYEELRARYRNEGAAVKAVTQQQRIEEFNRLLTRSKQTAAADAVSAALLNYGHYVLKRIWEEDLALDRKISYLKKSRTQYKFDVNAAVSYLTFMKVLDPASVLDRYCEKDNFLGAPAEKLSLHDLYSSLDFLKEHKDALMQWVNRRVDQRFGKTRASMVFYDVTNAYFESPLTDAELGLEQKDFLDNLYDMAQAARAAGELKDECFDENGCLIAEALPESFIKAVADEKIQFLKMRGPSKEHRFDLPIVSIALIVDSFGIPMDFAVYAGNDSEFKSMRKSIEEFKKKYDITDVTVSADRGINSVKNLQMLHESGLGFLVAQKVTQFSKALTDKMLDRSLYTPFDSSNPEAGGYQIIKNWTKRGRTKDGDVKCTLVLTYNEKRRQRDKAILELWKSIVEQKMKIGYKLGPRKNGWTALADIGEEQDKPILGINQEVYERKLALCGFAALVYDAPNKESSSASDDGKADAQTQVKEPPRQLEGPDIAMAYKRQCQIEECFRIMKNNLGLRPMYVWTSDHVRGHVTLCVLALVLIRLLQHKLQAMGASMSVREICKTLGNAQVAAIKTEVEATGPDVAFLSCEKRPSLRRGRERVQTEELIAALNRGSIKLGGIGELLKAVGLEVPPRFCKRAELARCLRTRFDSVTDAVPPVCWATM